MDRGDEGKRNSKQTPGACTENNNGHFDCLEGFLGSEFMHKNHPVVRLDLPNIRITRACPLLVLPLFLFVLFVATSGQPFRLTPCKSLLLCSLIPISMYRPHITIMGTTKNRKLDTSNVCSRNLFLI